MQEYNAFLNSLGMTCPAAAPALSWDQDPGFLALTSCLPKYWRST